jgi:drug/metabolite transporter (DMT)-like permease
MTNKSLPASVWIVFFVLCIVWGTTYLGIKIGVQYFPPFFFSSFRHLIAGAIFTIPLLLRGHQLPSKRDLLRITVVGICMITGGNALLSWAEKTISSGLAGIISALTPLFITLLSFVFFKGFKITWLIFVGLMLCIGGILFLTKPDAATMSEGFEEGLILALFANVFWALGSIFMKKYPVDTNIYLRSGLQMLIAGAINMVISLIFEPTVDFATVPSEAWWAIAYLIFVGSLIGYSSFVYCLDYMAPARLSVHVYINTIVAVVVGWLFGSEPLNFQMFVTMAIILVGVLIVNREYSKMAKASSN